MGWRYIGSALPAGTAPADYLDTIVGLFASVLYADGSPRAAGAGYAWSLESEEGTPRAAVSFQGPTGCGHTARVVIVGAPAAGPMAGFAHTGAGAMASPEVTANNKLHAMTSIGGSLSTWTGLNPMGVGTRINGFDAVGLFGGAAGTVRAWESPKGICIVYKNGTGFSGLIQGAWIRPWNPAGALGSEPDGHLYGGFCTGSAETMVIDEDGSAYNHNFSCRHIASTGRAHGHVLQPGGGNNLYYLRVERDLSTTAVAATHKTPDGEWVRQKLTYMDTAQTAYGYAYDMGFVPRDMLGVTRYDGANPSYYVISASSAVVGDAIGLYYDET